ncbi:hemolysin III family protein [Alteromonadaceae bacterium M269]|nr:hemolysin III family protein [Alteromonadaceae bacterium M269]
MNHGYSQSEERLNIFSHLLGFGLSLIALVAMLISTAPLGLSYSVSAFIFGTSLAVLYAASSLYHAQEDPVKRQKLRTFDHCSIFILIAGTYTPITLVTLPSTIGWIIFGIVWGIAALGITLKLFFTGRFKKTSTALYVLMGWIIIVVGKTLMENIAPVGFNWLLGGGIAYTIGAILYSIKRLPYNHAIFHCFVLAGSACHFVAIYNYVLISPTS